MMVFHMPSSQSWHQNTRPPPLEHELGSTYYYVQSQVCAKEVKYKPSLKKPSQLSPAPLYRNPYCPPKKGFSKDTQMQQSRLQLLIKMITQECN